MKEILDSNLFIHPIILISEPYHMPALVVLSRGGREEPGQTVDSRTHILDEETDMKLATMIPCNRVDIGES